MPKPLADKAHLLPDLLQKSRANSTTQKYRNSFAKFQLWASVNGLGSGDTLPARAFTVAIYLASLIQSANSVSPIISAYYGIKWYHDIHGLNSPTESSLVVNVLEAGKRVLAKETVKKEPVTVDIISALYQRVYEHGNIKSQSYLCCITGILWFYA